MERHVKAKRCTPNLDLSPAQLCSVDIPERSRRPLGDTIDCVTVIQELVGILEDAFAAKGIEDTGESQSMLGNLASVPNEFWQAKPPGGERTIASIVLHVGGCIVMYDEYAFGAGRLQWDDPALVPWSRDDAPMVEAIDWMTSAHRRFVDHVAALDDDALGGAAANELGRDGSDEVADFRDRHALGVSRRRDQPHPELAAAR